MRIDGVASALRSRARHPGRIGLLLLVPVGWAVVRLFLNLPAGRFGPSEAFIPLALMVIGLLVAPMSWQWTGEDASLAPMGRGLLQSLIWNGLWVLLLVFAFAAWADAERPARPLPPAFPQEIAPLFPGPPSEAQDPQRPDRPPPPRPGPEDPRPRPLPPLRHQEAAARRPDRQLREDPPKPTSPLSPELQVFSLGLLVCTVLGRVMAEREALEAREEALQAKADQAKALALQAQMQPHALFNALSGLVELAQDDPQATEEALVALCDYLRRLMAHGRATGGLLRAERELLEDYLRIEQIRLGDRLQVQWTWPAWADELKMPPLLLQPLVENAILHGIAPVAEGGKLRIALSRQSGTLQLEVANTGRAPAGQRNGTGLGHLRERLALWHPSTSFELGHDGEWTRARILIPEPLPPC